MDLSLEPSLLTESEDTAMDLDTQLAPLTKWRTIMYCLIGLSMHIPGVWHSFSIVFLGAAPRTFSCKTNTSETFQCGSSARSTLTNESLRQTCTAGWSYEKEVGQTIVTEWDLVCEKDYLVDLSQSLYSVGVLVGAVGLNTLADKFGRKPVFLLSLWFTGLFGVIAAFATDIIFFMVFRVLIGVFREGSFMVGAVMTCELFPTSERYKASVVMEICWVGYFLFLALLGYLVRNWRILEIVISAPLILTISFIWIIPESVIWLNANGCKREIWTIIRRAQGKSKHSPPVEVTKDSIDYVAAVKTQLNCRKTEGQSARKNNQPKRISIIDLCQSRIMAFTCIIMCLVWFLNIMVSNALSLGSTLLPGDRYLNFFLSGLVEIPSTITAIIGLQRFGRPGTLFCFHLLNGIVLLVLVLSLHLNLPAVASTALALVGKSAITGSIVILNLYTIEIYPTNLRNFGTGISAICGRLGGIVAPQFVYLARTNTWIPNTVFGCLSVVVAFLGLYLPETKGRALPNSIEEIELWRRKTRPTLLMVSTDKNQSSPCKEDLLLSTNHTKDINGNVGKKKLVE